MKPDLIAKNPKANAIWNYYKRKLLATGKWKDEYSAQFAVLVDAILGFLKVSETLETEGNGPLLLNPKKGTTYRNPLLDIKAGHIHVIRVYGAAFGLNPLADARLRSVPTDALGDLFKFIRGPDSPTGGT